jgi:hypothetical protein
MQKFECLENIIGVTKDFCQCLHGQIAQEEFDKNAVSKSGLYLDNVEGGLTLRNVAQITACKTFYQLQVDAIANAKNFFSADILKELNLKYQVQKTNFLGEIGKVSFTSSLNTTKRLQFLKLSPKNDAVIQLDRIRIFLNKDITTKVWILRIAEGQTEAVMIYENENVTTQNQTIIIPFNEALKLPLNLDGKAQNYYFVYERLDSTLQPRDIRCSCGCSGGDAYSQFLAASGGEVELFSDFVNAGFDGYTHGFSLDVAIRCETGAVICKEYDENDAIAYLTAYAIMYKAGELVIESVMASSEVNRITLLNKEHLWGKRNHFKKEYNDKIKYLSENIDVSSSDCFICRENGIQMGNLLN